MLETHPRLASGPRTGSTILAGIGAGSLFANGSRLGQLRRARPATRRSGSSLRSQSRHPSGQPPDQEPDAPRRLRITARPGLDAPYDRKRAPGKAPQVSAERDSESGDGLLLERPETCSLRKCGYSEPKNCQPRRSCQIVSLVGLRGLPIRVSYNTNRLSTEGASSSGARRKRSRYPKSRWRGWANSEA